MPSQPTFLLDLAGADEIVVVVVVDVCILTLKFSN